MNRLSWLQTYSEGAEDGAIDLFDPRPGQYTIEAIAHSLALTNRFRGMTREPYSVAQHCVLGARIFADRDRFYALGFLLHELDEVVMGDVLPGVKGYLDTAYMPLPSDSGLAFGDWLERHERVALKSLGLLDLQPTLHSKTIKECDFRMLATEKRDLLGKSPRPWYLEAEPFPDRIRAWPWYQAEQAFLQTYKRLREWTTT